MIEKYAKIFDVLSNEIRLCILLSLYKNGSKNVSDLIICANASQSNVSQQLSKLRLMNIIESKKVGNEVFYSIVDHDIIRFLKEVGN